MLGIGEKTNDDLNLKPRWILLSINPSNVMKYVREQFVGEPYIKSVNLLRTYNPVPYLKTHFV